jgi:2-amino-4-hydroxy-6-hydroxymethyldihydropteridine diphosphokinase
MKQLVRVAIGLGSNQGDREAFLRAAAERLREEFLEDFRGSSLYETEPWGITDQPKFLNAVVSGFSEWKPPAIVNYLKQLEAELGRKHTVRNGPREIDLDLLVYGDTQWKTEGVTVPHERLAERDFVLVPLNEVWPEWRHPLLGMTPNEMLAKGKFPPLKGVSSLSEL